MSALDEVAGWPVDTVAAGWIDRSGLRRTAGHSDRAFALASVTKPLVAYAILVAIEEGSLDLDQSAGPEGSTIRHLLSHASGLGDDETTPLAPVGRRRVYSNGGYDLLGNILAAATGFTAVDYVNAAVAEPLGLRVTRLAGSPAHGAVGSVDDLLTIAAEWLNPTLLSRATLRAATSVQFPDLAGVLPGYGRQDPNPWGLGFELKGSKDPHWTGATNSPATFGHFGRAGTFVWVDPTIGVGCVALADRPFDDWARLRWPTLSDGVVAEARTAGQL